jgi:hypothetical protein
MPLHRKAIEPNNHILIPNKVITMVNNHPAQPHEPRGILLDTSIKLGIVFPSTYASNPDTKNPLVAKNKIKTVGISA